MRVAARTLGRTAMFAVALSPLLLSGGTAVADDSAAHALADKFSRAEDAERAAAEKKAEERKRAEAEKARAEAQRQAQRRKAAAEQRAKDEAEMLDRARAEAEARRLEEQRAADERARIEAEQEAARAEAARLAQEAEQRRLEEERTAEEARQAEAARLAKEVEEKRLAEERKAEEERKTEEARQAEAARIAREAEERKAEEARQAEAQRLAKEAEERKAEEARIAKEAEEKRLAEQRRAARLAKESEEKRRAEAARKAEEQRQADAAREALEKMRTEEAERVAEKFRLAREAREAKLARERSASARDRGEDTRDSLGGPLPDAQAAPAPWDTPNDAPARYLPTRVTILLVMDPRHRIFAAYPPRANPVLCIGEGCYISGGANAPAEYMPRWSALGPANSIGRRAGPCRDQLTCVFRDVELGGGYGQILPVDMGLLHHERREIRGVHPDPTCDLVSGRLYCGEPVVAKGYRAWIVPEVIATKAGPDALREALALGLPAARSATLDPWRSQVHAESSR